MDFTSQEESDAFDLYISNLIAQSASTSNPWTPYSTAGGGHLGPMGHSSFKPTTNKTFLSNIIKNTDGYNDSIKRQGEMERLRAELKVFRERFGKKNQSDVSKDPKDSRDTRNHSRERESHASERESKRHSRSSKRDVDSDSHSKREKHASRDSDNDPLRSKRHHRHRSAASKEPSSSKHRRRSRDSKEPPSSKHRRRSRDSNEPSRLKDHRHSSRDLVNDHSDSKRRRASKRSRDSNEERSRSRHRHRHRSRHSSTEASSSKRHRDASKDSKDPSSSKHRRQSSRDSNEPSSSTKHDSLDLKNTKSPCTRIETGEILESELQKTIEKTENIKQQNVDLMPDDINKKKNVGETTNFGILKEDSEIKHQDPRSAPSASRRKVVDGDSNPDSRHSSSNGDRRSRRRSKHRHRRSVSTESRSERSSGYRDKSKNEERKRDDSTARSRRKNQYDAYNRTEDDGNTGPVLLRVSSPTFVKPRLHPNPEIPKPQPFKQPVKLAEKFNPPTFVAKPRPVVTPSVPRPDEYERWLHAVATNKGESHGVLKKMEKETIMSLKLPPPPPKVEEELLAYRPPQCPW